MLFLFGPLEYLEGWLIGCKQEGLIVLELLQKRHHDVQIPVVLHWSAQTYHLVHLLAVLSPHLQPQREVDPLLPRFALKVALFETPHDQKGFFFDLEGWEHHEAEPGRPEQPPFVDFHFYQVDASVDSVGQLVVFYLLVPQLHVEERFKQLLRGEGRFEDEVGFDESLTFLQDPAFAESLHQLEPFIGLQVLQLFLLQRHLQMHGLKLLNYDGLFFLHSSLVLRMRWRLQLRQHFRHHFKFVLLSLYRD